MQNPRNSRAAACLTLLLSGCALAALAPASRADAPAPQKESTVSLPSAPVVKIDGAMLQEREAFPDGTAHLRTFLQASPTQSVKNAPKAGTVVVTAAKV